MIFLVLTTNFSCYCFKWIKYTDTSCFVCFPDPKFSQPWQPSAGDGLAKPGALTASGVVSGGSVGGVDGGAAPGYDYGVGGNVGGPNGKITMYGATSYTGAESPPAYPGYPSVCHAVMESTMF